MLGFVPCLLRGEGDDRLATLALHGLSDAGGPWTGGPRRQVARAARRSSWRSAGVRSIGFRRWRSRPRWRPVEASNRISSPSSCTAPLSRVATPGVGGTPRPVSERTRAPTGRSSPDRSSPFRRDRDASSHTLNRPEVGSRSPIRLVSSGRLNLAAPSVRLSVRGLLPSNAPRGLRSTLRAERPPNSMTSRTTPRYVGDLLSSPVGGGGVVGRWLAKMLRPTRRRGGGGPPGADAPTAWLRPAPMRAVPLRRTAAQLPTSGRNSTPLSQMG